MMHSELEHVDLLCINDPTAILSPRTLKGLVPGGAIFMQSPYTDPAEVWKRIPERNQQTHPREEDPRLLRDMVKIAREVASEADLQMRMQGIVLLGAFLQLTPYARESNMTDEQVYAGVEKALRKYFGKRGDRVVQDNLNCVKRGYSEMKEIPPSVIEHDSNDRVRRSRDANAVAGRNARCASQTTSSDDSIHPGVLP